ncbi:MAG: endonuclease/exonuclease/phosphatase family protein [Micromonosporaceae bacterium]
MRDTAQERPAVVARPTTTTAMALLAVVAMVAAEALRMSGPALDRIVTSGGTITAAVTALIVFALPVLVGLLVAGVGARRGAAIAVVALVALRLVAQALPDLLVVAGLVTAALGALVLLVRQIDAVPAVTGLVLGGALDVAVRTVFVTWDPVWQSGFLPWLVVIAECVALLLALSATRPALASDPYPVGPVGLLGGYLALSVLMFGSPAFVASASGLSQVYVAAALLVGALFAIEALSRSALPGGSGRWTDLDRNRAGGIAGAMLVIGVTAGILLTGVWVVLAVMLAQVGAALVLARGLAPRRIAVPEEQEEYDPAEARAAAELESAPELDEDLDEDADLVLRPRRRSPVGFAIAGLATGLGYIVVVLLYQVHYDIPLPVPNQMVPIVAALVLAGLALGERPWSAPATPRHDARAAKRGKLAPLAVLPAVLLLAPVLMLVTAPAPAEPPKDLGDSFRMVSWNLHYFRNADGMIDPDAVATAIEQQKPDVVMLQEVGRGWPIGGGLDGAEWLSRRLAMPYVYAPAADEQFGNLILSRIRIVKTGYGDLPQGNSPMDRSYASATVELPNGRTVRLIDVHLANREQDTAARQAQVAALLKGWDGDTPSVIAGDFNAVPGSAELQPVTAAGFVSAQDTTGHSGLPTAPTDRPAFRIDWIFGTPDVSFEKFERPGVTASDHFPLAVTVTLG